MDLNIIFAMVLNGHCSVDSMANKKEKNLEKSHIIITRSQHGRRKNLNPAILINY